MRFFLKMFFSLLVLELSIHMAIALSGQLLSLGNIMGGFFRFIESFISLPVSLLDSRLPFYYPQSAFLNILSFLVNIFIHTLIIYTFIRLILKKRKN